MPAYQLKQTGMYEETEEKSGKTEEKKEQLRKEIEEYTGAGSVYRRKLQRFMERHGIWSISELDYEWRLVFAGELHALAKPKYHSYYLKYFDHIKQYDMRKHTIQPRSWWNGWTPARNGRNGYGIFQRKHRER